jgi:hypothetical protein
MQKCEELLVQFAYIKFGTSNEESVQFAYISSMVSIATQCLLGFLVSALNYKLRNLCEALASLAWMNSLAVVMLLKTWRRGREIKEVISRTGFTPDDFTNSLYLYLHFLKSHCHLEHFGLC